ncbi:hypothetical protein ACF0H5_015780 [Mactra antiquata]
MSDERKKSRKSRTFTKKKKPSTSDQKGRKRQTEANTAVIKHMRIAHGITGPSSTMKDNNMINFNMMARSRISQKVGLINTGKKGAPASKPISIPEHISKQVDERTKKLVQEAESDVHCSGNLDIAETKVLSKNRSLNNTRSTPGSAASRNAPSTGYSVEIFPNFTTPNNTGGNVFPQELHAKETILNLLSSMKNVTRQFYPGRNYLRETQEKLLRLFKNETPRSSTPTKTPIFHDLVRPELVKRSLMDSFEKYSSAEPDQNAPEICPPIQTPTNHHSYGDNHTNGSRPKDDFNSVMSKHSHCDRVLSNLSNFRDKCVVQNDNGLHTRDRYNQKSYQEKQGYPAKRPSYEDRHGQEDRSKHIRDEIRAFIDSGKHVTNLCRSDRASSQDTGSCDEINICFNSQSSYNGGSKHDIDNKFRRHDKMIMHRSDNVRGCFVNGNNIFKKDVFSHRNDLNFDNMFEVNAISDDIFLANHKASRDEITKSPVLNWINSASQDEEMYSSAKDMLQANQMNKQASMFEPMDVEVRKTEDAVNLLEKNDIVMQMSSNNKPTLMMDSKTYETKLDELIRHGSHSNSRSSFGSQDSSHGRSIPQRHVQKDINYMPGFHDSYYLYHMGTGDLAWEHGPNESKIEAMDILDHVDQQVHTECYIDGLGERISNTGSTSQHYSERKSHNTYKQHVMIPPSPASPDCPKFYPKKMY